MFGRSVKLFTIFGFEIKLDISWVFIAVLIAWSLAQGYFPSVYEGLRVQTYWWMGIAGMLGLFASILLHEIAHSLVARIFGVEVKSITLWLLGGLAELSERPPSPRAEFFIAIAGPITSLALGALAYAATQLLVDLPGLQSASAVLRYLFFLNVAVAIFNMVPAFPLDGGHVLRAIIWARKDDLFEATRIAARAGSTFGMVLIILGILNVVITSSLNGLWLVLLGIFVRAAADSSFHALEVEHILTGQTVKKLVSPHPVSVSQETTIQSFVDDWIFQYRHDVFPVVSGADLVGMIPAERVKTIPREQWGEIVVRQLMEPISDVNSIDASEDVSGALKRMQSSGLTRLIVTESGRLAGVLALQDIAKLISLKRDLELPA